MASPKKDYQQMLRKLEAIPGWSVTPRKAGHLMLKAPNGEIYFASSTPSDHRAILNVRAWCRRQGAEI